MKKCNSNDACCIGDDINLTFKEEVRKIPSDEKLYNDSEILKAIADPLRLKILYLLKNGELCACHIDSALNKPQSTISHHLAILKKSSLVSWRKEGKWTYFSLANPKLIRQIENIIRNEE